MAVLGLCNISIVLSHVKVIQNTVADFLSRRRNFPEEYTKLHQLVQDPILVNTHKDLTLLTMIVSTVFCFVDCEALTTHLASQVCQRFWLGFCTSTPASYKRRRSSVA